MLLHEVGHTLGALHELDETSIMNPRYSTRLRRFGPQTLEVMRAVLAHRTPTGGLDPSGREAVVALLRREPAPWVPAERAKELERFETPAPAATATPAGVTAGLPQPDEAAFEDASRLLAAGDASGAGRVAKPLFGAYPNVRAVSELRCNIALKSSLPWEIARQECAALTQGVFESH